MLDLADMGLRIAFRVSKSLLDNKASKTVGDKDDVLLRLKPLLASCAVKW